ncbi:hypothetical protein JZ751_026474 [Albula glossodonta]|uniref:Uncharacterized protein n=1 Tax=Albula glossodonta TaxID=121402 RepID=A0A8T2PG39_9TELE|nr:hypothetical protein JZ751_026474 [Albula glossodonta]
MIKDLELKCGRSIQPSSGKKQRKEQLGPGAGLKRAGLSKGVWMSVAVPAGWRKASGLVAMVQRVAGLSGLGRKLAVRLLQCPGSEGAVTGHLLRAGRGV